MNVSFGAWYLTPGSPPEASLLSGKPSTAISFSGGGSRSYTVSIGYLLGLREMSVLNSTRYISGVSGGSWATAAFSYAQFGAAGDSVPRDEAELLDEYVPPEALNMTGLKHMPARSARRGVTHSFDAAILEKWVTNPLSTAWCDVMYDNFLAPLGVAHDAAFVVDNASAVAARARNPDFLRSAKFVWPRADRPWPIINMALLGPQSLSPFKQSDRRYAMVEATPLYVGISYARNLSYVGEYGKEETHTVGGGVEPWAFDLSAKIGLGGASHATLQTSTPAAPPFSLRVAMGASSYFLGGFVAGVPLIDQEAMERRYFSAATRSPTEAPTDAEFLFADGGTSQNLGLIGLLQRRVRSIVLFCNFETPLSSARKWNPLAANATATLTRDTLEDDLPTYFGVVPQGLTNKSRGTDVLHNAVFSPGDFAPTVAALQQAQLRGSGAVVTTPLTTVSNAYYGLPAGISANVTWVYLSRCTEWEQRLPAELRALVVPEKDADDPSSLRKHGTFKGFPHFSTTDLSLSAEKANLLASLCAWVIKQNEALLRAALGPTPV